MVRKKPQRILFCDTWKYEIQVLSPISKVLLEYSHAHSFMFCLWLLSRSESLHQRSYSLHSLKPSLKKCAAITPFPTSSMGFLGLSEWNLKAQRPLPTSLTPHTSSFPRVHHRHTPVMLALGPPNQNHHRPFTVYAKLFPSQASEPLFLCLESSSALCMTDSFSPGLSLSVISSKRPFLSAPSPHYSISLCASSFIAWFFPSLHFCRSPPPGHKLHLDRAHIRGSMIVCKWMNEWPFLAQELCVHFPSRVTSVSGIEIIPIKSSPVFYSPLGSIIVINHWVSLPKMLSLGDSERNQGDSWYLTSLGKKCVPFSAGEEAPCSTIKRPNP